MNILTIRDVTIGGQKPRIIAPIVEPDPAQIPARAQAVRASGADICEWRIDHFADGAATDAVCALAADVRDALGDMPLLITFRTREEGGAAAIAPEMYADLLRALCDRRAADLIDVEYMHPAAQGIIDHARRCGVATVASNHDFAATPPEAEIVDRLTRMAQMGADIAKIAVMPNSPADVLTLLQATHRAAETLPCPLITMAMGQTGMLSRIAGGTFGSACTFGSAGQASAPGQLPVSELRRMLDALYP